MSTQEQQAAFWLQYSQQLSNAIRYTEALAAAEKAVALSPANPEAWYTRGTCFAMLARYQEALADFEQSLTLQDHDAAAWDAKAWVLGILGHKQEALAAVNRALEIDPNYLEAQRRKERLEVL